LPIGDNKLTRGLVPRGFHDGSHAVGEKEQLVVVCLDARAVFYGYADGKHGPSPNLEPPRSNTNSLGCNGGLSEFSTLPAGTRLTVRSSDSTDNVRTGANGTRHSAQATRSSTKRKRRKLLRQDVSVRVPQWPLHRPVEGPRNSRPV